MIWIWSWYLNWLQNANTLKLGCPFFSHFIEWNWRPLSLKCWHFEASEDIMTKFKSEGLHIIKIKYWKVSGSGNPPSLIHALQKIAILGLKTGLWQWYTGISVFNDILLIFFSFFLFNWGGIKPRRTPDKNVRPNPLVSTSPNMYIEFSTKYTDAIISLPQACF